MEHVARARELIAQGVKRLRGKRAKTEGDKVCQAFSDLTRLATAQRARAKVWKGPKRPRGRPKKAPEPAPEQSSILSERSDE